jgi:hypothetical protein
MNRPLTLLFFFVTFSGLAAEPEKRIVSTVPDLMFAGAIMGFLSLVYFAYFFLKAKNKKGKPGSTL